ncbi:MAG: hypothetical protein A2X31_03835 [Elusimicrobia bacterium GWB2_63_22]|nr:MAG: hypothetical protein A2X31_03835 [Elusimicrobia bacterium GWB2_63_22]
MRPERAAVLPYGLPEREYPAFVRRWDRVYCGSSFCPGLAPAAARIAAIYRAGASAVTVLTPFVTDASLAKTVKLLGEVFRAGLRPQISVSDLGLLSALRAGPCRRASFTLGRPLSHDFLRMPAQFLKKFFAENGIAMIETDEADMASGLSSGGLKVAFHYPFRYVTMTRCCPWTGRMGNCARPACSGRRRTFTASGMPGRLLLSENAYFFRTGKPPIHPAVVRTVFTS